MAEAKITKMKELISYLCWFVAIKYLAELAKYIEVDSFCAFPWSIFYWKIDGPIFNML